MLAVIRRARARPCGRSMRAVPGFSLVELLVVITVIVLLLAILVPSLSRALGAAEAATCGANESAAGKALAMLLNDKKRMYPVLDNYNGLFGNLGNTTIMGSDHHGAYTRPLNPYLGYEGVKGAKVDSAIKVAQCPSDRGDPFFDIPSAYEAVGVSYMPQMAYDDFRTKHVFGWNGHGQAPLERITAPLPTDARSSLRSTSITRPDNKIILADWVWHGDRPYSDERTRWHDPDQRRFNTLFADGHVEFFYFDPAKIEVGGSDDAADNWETAPNPSFTWW
jgi:prepilin-type N-terminal cleavage/methylation domain-containing protein/prepilin-type processing-associated H-X9-DG protein